MTVIVICLLALLTILLFEKVAADREALNHREEVLHNLEMEKTHVRCCDGWSVWWEPKEKPPTR